MSTAPPSFFAPVPEGAAADAYLEDYERFLIERNGTLGADHGFERRHELMDDLGAMPGMFDGPLDHERVQRAYVGDHDDELTEEEMAILAFVKINAGEAYGVEVVTAARADVHRRHEPLYRLEGILAREETFHTRMLRGVTGHVDGLHFGDGWRPPVPLKLLVFALAKAPPMLFHPIVVGAEVAGVFTFDWLLRRTHTLFPHHPEVRESMERRLIEILIDEVGHIAYNRIAVGNNGLRAGQLLAGQVVKAQDHMNPQAIALGLDDARHELAGFDHASLPEEVRRRAFFV
ncbi:MAG: hypothetical protein AAGD35_06355 [Actinomycetota bacterium]